MANWRSWVHRPSGVETTACFDPDTGTPKVIPFKYQTVAVRWIVSIRAPSGVLILNAGAPNTLVTPR